MLLLGLCMNMATLIPSSQWYVLGSLNLFSSIARYAMMQTTFACVVFDPSFA